MTHRKSRIHVHVQNLSFRYGKNEVIHRLSQTFEAGRITGILGHNGSGKSTLVKNILGFLHPREGQVSFLDEEGKNVEDHDLSGHKGKGGLKRSRIVSLVPQRPGDFSAQRVFDLVQMGRLPYLKDRWAGFTEEDRKITEHVLEILGLSSFSERMLGSLSGGEQQKIMLARCLVQDTPVILLDEATASLDMHHKVEIMEMLRRDVQQTGLTVIAVMHDLNLAAQFCDTLVLMKQGRIRAWGSPLEVMVPEHLGFVYDMPVRVFLDERNVPFVLPGRNSAQWVSHVC